MLYLYIKTFRHNPPLLPPRQLEDLMKCHPREGSDSRYDCFVLTSEIQLLNTIGSALYGLYTILYVLCMYILLTRRRNRRRVHCVLITVIYITATIGYGLRYTMYSIENQASLIRYTTDLPIFNDAAAARAQLTPEEKQYLADLKIELSSLESPLQWMKLAVLMLTIVAKGITDFLMLWRCYLIWDCKMRVILVPMLFCLGTSILGVYGAILTSQMSFASFPLVVFALSTFTSNVVLTLLIAGRILFITRRVNQYLPPDSKPRKMYRTIISATLESGLIYPTVLLTYAVSVLHKKGTETEYMSSMAVVDVTFDSSIYVMGIASVLIIVRVSLGIAVHDEKSFMETIIRDQKSSPAEPVTQTIIDIRREAHDNPRF
ncbi:hypothetical protein PM082_021998 [Marasmius tenuissimus]|nr:hypothetical protein PM082_021998 [Marasmius tenuissimus]